ncbi:MAG: type II toxin-antitoxin system RelB/DinJ family antitoxin [Clostridia bacterium]|nr:type II toxin-antitoxin system RelB/DinJ family antitoxin [Clostridia bacterium]
MAQATFSVRMDESLKEQFDTLCRDFGMNMTTAINVFARAVVLQRRIPFEISSPEPQVTRNSAVQAFRALREQAKDNGVSDMTLDEINAEIAAARREMSE